MNSDYYTQPVFPGNTMQPGGVMQPGGTMQPGGVMQPGGTMQPGSAMPSGFPNQQTAPTMEQMMQVTEQSFIENIFRLNKGKIVKVYMSFPDSVDWRDRIFAGVIEAAGRDHLVVSDPNTGIRTLLPLIYLTFAEFEEPIKYSPTFETPPR